jgi:rhamnosyltransferase
VIQLALIGSRGIPAKYGGSESITEELARRLTDKGFKVFVACESRRFSRDEYKGITRVHSPAVEGGLIPVLTINDVVATFHLIARFPSIKILCYTNYDIAPLAFIPRLLGKKVIMNTDGIEWKRPLIRENYLSPAYKLLVAPGSLYLKSIEWMAIKVSNIVIADSRAIKAYLEERHNAKNVIFISYGARELISSEISDNKEKEILDKLGLSKQEYYLTVARIVAENNVDKGIAGFLMSNSKRKMIVVGNFNKKDGYTKYLMKLGEGNTRITFLDPIYDKETLGILRKNCFAYVHAYELGGTNPSLLEQMVFGRPILANDVSFHREILEDGGLYFRDEQELSAIINKLEGNEFDLKKMSGIQARRLNEEYNWDSVVEKYERLFEELSDRH